ncbi:hypothetical protein G7Z17_g12945 [Cylindrodendrum hubeiense]|uniref:Uncharacterized protein n=1 Tax=Cylindrodendrum hubeiense TaxID=595255 RepID=A0A9P5GT41_9HYPO|nr:hypothetical protein G7Z17_g12945 [Cylindrodendrum hubeiense]
MRIPVFGFPTAAMATKTRNSHEPSARPGKLEPIQHVAGAANLTQPKPVKPTSMSPRMATLHRGGIPLLHWQTGPRR